MRKTLKDLKNDLERAENGRDNYYRKWQEAEDTLKKQTEKEMFGMKQDNMALTELTTTLKEIIRWQINPETTKYPYMPEKGQRDENNGRRV